MLENNLIRIQYQLKDIKVFLKEFQNTDSEYHKEKNVFFKQSKKNYSSDSSNKNDSGVESLSLR